MDQMFNKRYKVVIIAGQLVVGGAEKQLYLWLSNLDRTKFQPIVLTLHPGYGDYWEPLIESLGIPLINIRHRSNRLLRLVEIIRVLKPYHPDLIHGWHLFASPYAAIAGKILGARSLGGIRGNFQAFHSNKEIFRLTRWFTNAFIVNSSSTADQIKTSKSAENKTIYTVQNAAEDLPSSRINNRNELSQRFGLSLTSMWIGTIGRLDATKRFDLLIEGLVLLLKDGVDFHFLLFGDGLERRKLEKKVFELGLEKRVTFAGEEPEARLLLNALDVFCFTSMVEGLPNVILEAAVAALPIVAWKLPFMEEILEDGVSGLLVEPLNLQAFKDAVLSLCNSQPLRKRLGEAARNHVLKTFTLERYVKSMSSVYEDLLGINSNEDLVK